MNKPRRFLIVTTAISFTMLFRASAQVAQKGVGNWPGIPRATENMDALKIGWYYDWGTSPVGKTPGIQFVPMIWGHKNVNSNDLAAAAASGAGVLLGFNEPNEKSQSHMTVEQAIADWPHLQATGLRLGSPALGTGDDTKTNGWLAQFMAQIKAHGYRVDFICIHPYQSNFDVSQATEALRKEIELVHNTYRLPVWVTEYGMVNWDTDAYPDADTAARFATSSAALMKDLPYVERYAWYSLIPNQKTLSLANSDGSLNVIGRAWAEARGGVKVGLIPQTPAKAPNYYCTWAAQNYAYGQGTARYPIRRFWKGAAEWCMPMKPRPSHNSSDQTGGRRRFIQMSAGISYFCWMMVIIPAI